MRYDVINFIAQIKNASLAKRRTVTVGYKRMNKEVGEILVKNGFLESVKEEIKDGKKVLTAIIRYEDREPVLTDIAIISKPSLRTYRKKKSFSELKRRGMGISLISTNKGIMTSVEAEKQGVGGELLFRIW